MSPGRGDLKAVVFVTGRIAEHALRRILDTLDPPFRYRVVVLPIAVAALLRTDIIARHLELSPDTDLVVLPGLCRGDLGALRSELGCEVERGPIDLIDIPAYFGAESELPGYGTGTMQIIAEINEAPHKSIEEIIALAEAYRSEGADVLDVMCEVDVAFPHYETVLRELRDRGMRLAVDTFDRTQILQAVDAGVEIILSVNRSNMDIVGDLHGSGTSVVVLPDFDAGPETLYENVAAVAAAGVDYYADPILRPIGLGFVQSLSRFIEARARLPEARLLMGVGNIVELLVADSSGVNAVLAAICQELDVAALLTTPQQHWARGVIRELGIARQLMHYAVTNRIPPPAADTRLLTLRDVSAPRMADEELREIHRKIRDPNFRIFVGDAQITMMNRDLFLQGTDPDEFFAASGVDDPSHAFYIGRELERARTAQLLGKRYRQDNPLDWGYESEPTKSWEELFRPIRKRRS